MQDAFTGDIAGDDSRNRFFVGAINISWLHVRCPTGGNDDLGLPTQDVINL
jgi:hypothetical protein